MNQPDKVPMFLLLSLYGAKEMGISIEAYFSKADNVVEGQLKMFEKYNNDCIYGFYYASIETEAFGGSTKFISNGPPNANGYFLSDFEMIHHLKCPVIDEAPGLQRVLESTRKLKAEIKDQAPIIGVVMSPFSLPVMQLGFEAYLDLMIGHKDLFWKLMEVNEAFCVQWANAQLEAGATAICYFDPVSSPTNISPAMYRESGFKVAQKTIAQINGPTATHLASGRALPIMDDLKQTGTAIVGVSSLEDIAELKKAANSQINLIGNLNGIEMSRWTPEEAEEAVKNIILKAGKNGGLILSDNHGEIPYQVSEEVLLAIGKARDKYSKLL
jgi:uroporphyrinogen decarboxylase